jgi:hypothetical protein
MVVFKYIKNGFFNSIYIKKRLMTLKNIVTTFQIIDSIIFVYQINIIYFDLKFKLL